MKLAITGKGGVGKTTLSAALAILFSREGSRVVAIDADPDSNLAATLGFPHPEDIKPLSQMKDLIVERTGAQDGAFGGFFKLNPKVDDIPDAYAAEHSGIKLLVMGGQGRSGGSGCLCPENAFLRALMAHLLFASEDVVIMDMEAGIEHLTRGTARGVDALIVVVEPGERSLDTARRIGRLSADLGIGRIWAVANKVRGEQDREFILHGLPELELAASLPYSPEVIECGTGRAGLAQVLDGPVGREVQNLLGRLHQEAGRIGPLRG